MDVYGLYDLFSLHLRQLKVNNINTPKGRGIHPGKQTSGTWKSSIWKGETSSKPFIFGFEIFGGIGTKPTQWGLNKQG